MNCLSYLEDMYNSFVDINNMILLRVVVDYESWNTTLRKLLRQVDIFS